MSVRHMRVEETVEQTEDRIALARRNRMRLTSHYINVKRIVFYDHTGCIKRKGEVIAKDERCLLLKFKGGYKESFFYETLLELELNNKIEAEE